MITLSYFIILSFYCTKKLVTASLILASATYLKNIDLVTMSNLANLIFGEGGIILVVYKASYMFRIEECSAIFTPHFS